MHSSPVRGKRCRARAYRVPAWCAPSSSRRSEGWSGSRTSPSTRSRSGRWNRAVGEMCRIVRRRRGQMSNGGPDLGPKVHEGATIGHYLLGQEIGHGGFARVYEARRFHFEGGERIVGDEVLALKAERTLTEFRQARW